jgi:CubicO group peptidase (beta-lactamase class C family)
MKSDISPFIITQTKLNFYSTLNEKTCVNELLCPSGQFSTTAKDMALFTKFLMSDGTVNGKSFIDKALLYQMGNPTSTESYKNGLKSGYQFGLVGLF